MDDVIEQFRDAMRAAGIEPPGRIIAGGGIHRFSTNGDRKDDAGWYLLHVDGIAAGAFGDFRAGINKTWCFGSKATMTPEQRAEFAQFCQNTQREREAEQLKRYDEAAERAKKLWTDADDAADDHPYLVKKGVRCYGLKCEGERLLVQVQIDGLIRSLQMIDSGGEKRFLQGGQAGGGYFRIGGKAEPKSTRYIAEGYATAATIHASTSAPVFVAFNSGNLLPVAKMLRSKCPDAEIIVAADDDYRTTGNPGLTKAKEEAAQIGAKVAIPAFAAAGRGRATRVNARHLHLGLDRVRECLQAATASAAEELEAPRPLMREVPSADRFPVDALGDVLGNAAMAVHDRVRAPLAICGQAVLAAATLVVQGHADIVLPTGHRKPISNFFVTVAVTGERKSAVDTEVMAPICDYETELREIFDVELASYLNDQAAYEIARGNVEKQGKGAKALSRAEVKAKLDALGPAPARPLEPTLTCDEPTIQGLERHV